MNVITIYRFMNMITRIQFIYAIYPWSYYILRIIIIRVAMANKQIVDLFLMWDFPFYQGGI